MEDLLNKLKRDNEELKKVNKRFADLLLRSKSVIILGLLSDVNGTHEKDVQSFNAMCGKIGLERPPLIDDLYRVGGETDKNHKKQNLKNSVRLLVKFVSLEDKKKFMVHAKVLRKEHVYVNDDLSVEDRQKTWLLRCYVRKVLNLGVNFSIRNCVLKIWENGKIVKRFHVVDGKVEVLN